jgi:hypothetical protein
MTEDQLRARVLEHRIHQTLQQLPSGHPQAVFLTNLLRRLPRNPDGSLNVRALEEVAEQMDRMVHGASDELINMLPTRVYHRSASAGGGEGREELTSCMVCLEEYEEGEELRTLPCLHSFHKSCIDKWLGGKKQCPMCKTPIDIMLDESRLAEAGITAADVAPGGGGGDDDVSMGGT